MKAFLPQCNPEGVLSTMNTRKAPNHQAKVIVGTLTITDNNCDMFPLSCKGQVL
jgi:hypothetical protein